jgi:hypothetical protein
MEKKAIINSVDLLRYMLAPKPAVMPFNCPSVAGGSNTLYFIPPMNSTAYLRWALLVSVAKNKNNTVIDSVFTFNLRPVPIELARN